MKLYGFIYLQDMLRKRGLRHSRPYLNTLEQTGVLPKPENHYVTRLTEMFGTKESRAYTMEELEKCADIVYTFTREELGK